MRTPVRTYVITQFGVNTGRLTYDIYITHDCWHRFIRSIMIRYSRGSYDNGVGTVLDGVVGGFTNYPSKGYCCGRYIALLILEKSPHACI